MSQLTEQEICCSQIRKNVSGFCRAELCPHQCLRLQTGAAGIFIPQMPLPKPTGPTRSHINRGRLLVVKEGEGDKFTSDGKSQMAKKKAKKSKTSKPKPPAKKSIY